MSSGALPPDPFDRTLLLPPWVTRLLISRRHFQRHELMPLFATGGAANHVVKDTFRLLLRNEELGIRLPDAERGSTVPLGDRRAAVHAPLVVSSNGNVGDGKPGCRPDHTHADRHVVPREAGVDRHR